MERFRLFLGRIKNQINISNIFKGLEISNNHKSSENLRDYGPIVALATGCLVAVSYLVLKSVGFNSGGFVTFTWSCLVVGVCHILIRPTFVLRLIKDRPVILRGILFVLTQFLICLALRQGTASSALIAATVGNIIGVISGRLFLKESVSKLQYCGLGLAICGSLINPALYTVSVAAIFGGIVQGSNITNTRYIVRHKLDSFTVVGGSFLVAGIVGLILVIPIRNSSLGYTSTTIAGVLVLAGTITLLHYMICYSLHLVDTQRSAGFGLVRIPTIIGLEFAFFSVLPKPWQILSFVLITMGIAALLIKPKSTTTCAEDRLVKSI